MTRDDFVRSLLDEENEDGADVVERSVWSSNGSFNGAPPPQTPTLSVLFDVADSERRGWLTFTDYRLFYDLTRKPRAEYEIAFRLFDTEHRGKVTRQQFLHKLHQHLPPNHATTLFLHQAPRSPLLTLYFGRADGGGSSGGGSSTRPSQQPPSPPPSPKELTLEEFGQLLKGLQEERLRMEFEAHDSNGTGYVSAAVGSLVVGG